MRILAIIGALLLGLMLIFVGALGAVWYTENAARQGVPAGDSDLSEQTGPAVQSTDSPMPARGAPAAIEISLLQELLKLVEPRRRAAILEDPAVFHQFVTQEAANQAVLTAAYANAADQNPAVSTLMHRASQKILAETYLNEVVRQNLDANFPSEEQTREFYENNPDMFRLPDRMHIWQIFIPFSDDGEALSEKNARALTRQLIESIKSGKTDFAAAAKQHSKHAQSRVNDGYMGLVKLDDLLPDIRENVASLEMEAISNPIKTEAGMHIIKRGALVQGEVLEFEQIKPRIIQTLRREAAKRVRQAAVAKIIESYEVTVDELALDRWREALLSVDWQAAVAAGAPPKPKNSQ